MFRISIGLTCLVLSTLFVASAFGLIPDAEQAALEGRKRWTETVSLDCAFALQRRDEAFLKAYLPLLLQREPSLASIGLREVGGPLLYEGGDHGSIPNQETRSADLVSIPLVLQDKRWGDIEFRFKPRTGFLGIMPGSFLLLTI